MANTIEESKSGRAACRICRGKIDRGTLRFGEEVANAFDPDGGTSYAWHHLTCAAKKKPAAVEAALQTFSGEVPQRAELEATLAEAKATTRTFPYAERAPTGRSKCQACGEGIPKDELRVAFEREVERGGMSAPGAGYVHAACALGHFSDPELPAKLTANSRGLSGEDVEQLTQALAAAAS